MANESSAASISSFINDIFEGALLAARDQMIVAPTIRGFDDKTGLAVRVASEYTGGTFATLAETADLSSQTFTPGTLSTITPAQVGAQYFITDLRIESDPFNTQRDAAQDMGAEFGEYLDTLLVSNFSSLTGGTVGTAGGTLTWADLFKAQTRLRNQKAPGPYVAVVHPSQWYYLGTAITVGATKTNADEVQDGMARNGFFTFSNYGFTIYLDANITSGTAAVAAMYNANAIAIDMRRAPRLEPQRDASRGGGGWELNMTAVFGHGVWRPLWGVKMIGTSVLA